MCCIGKYQAQPIIEYYSAEANKIITKGFAGVSVENIGTIDAFLGEFKSPLEQGQIECFNLSMIEMSIDLPISWAQNNNPLLGRIKVKKYKLIEVCS
ncbi:MAG TPA: hypothetical protein VGF79_08745 [Bacteroidia bacterium]